MIEIPEANTLMRQLNKTVVGKEITYAVAGASDHGFAWYSADCAVYGALLNNKTVEGAACYGGRPEILTEDMILSFNDGVNIRYIEMGAKRPVKHQLLLEFADSSAIVCTVQMYGGMFCYPKCMDELKTKFTISPEDFYYKMAKEKPSPLSDAFDEEYFASLLTEKTKKLSAKAFLATEQRIPGLGNGVLQDILWKAGIHPKRKMDTLSDSELEELYKIVKSLLAEMTEKGGRDTEKDLFGRTGGYITVMSKKNDGMACPICGGLIKRMAYLGGNVYFCEKCQQ
jgi:formamidopyrimidine-DNA glycosylase